MESRSTDLYLPERAMESRAAVLEADVKHVRNDISEIKSDLRLVRDRIDKVNETLSDKIGRIERQIDSTKVWLLLIAAGLLGVMARGFKWL